MSGALALLDIQQQGIEPETDTAGPCEREIAYQSALVCQPGLTSPVSLFESAGIFKQRVSGRCPLQLPRAPQHDVSDITLDLSDVVANCL